jgi:hypothetical protein
MGLQDRPQLCVIGRPVQADGARASVVGQGPPDAQSMTLRRQLGDTGSFARRALLDL